MLRTWLPGETLDVLLERDGVFDHRRVLCIIWPQLPARRGVQRAGWSMCRMAALASCESCATAPFCPGFAAN